MFVLIVCVVLLVIDIFVTYRTNEIMKIHNEIHTQQIYTQQYGAEKETEAIETINVIEIKCNELLQKQKEISSISDKEEWFLAYKGLIEEYSEWVDPPESIYDYYTEEEIFLIQRVVETKTFECDFESRVNVACVVLNRVAHENFPDDITEVITSENQFAYGRTKIAEETILAVEYAFMIEDTTQGALYFHSNPKTETFNGAKYIFSDNAVHHFYK